MKKYIKGLILILSIGTTNLSYAQASYKIEKTSNVDIKLKGTSTLHNWEMQAMDASGDAQFTFKKGDASELSSIQSLSFGLKVKDLKSDNKGLDKNAYEALKSDTHKDINYTLNSVLISPEKDGYLLKTNGKLTIAGVTKVIALDVHSVVNSNGTISCKGTYQLKMTDYQVKPPTFLLGAMKTGNAITLDFSVVYKKTKEA